MRQFRKAAYVAPVLFAISSVNHAFAADLPQEPVVVPDYVQDWTGFYLGAFVGAGGIVNDISLPGLGGIDFNGVGGEGFFGGVMAGYNYQMTSQFLIGLEAEIGLSDLTTDASGGGFSLDARPEWFWAVSARLGWLPSADTMLYVIGGYSYADYNVDISLGGSASFSQDYSGFHVGTGMETRVSNRLSARVEYRYTQYGDEDWGTAGFIDVEPSSHTGRIALAYNLYDFGGGEVAPAAGYAPASWTGIYAGLYGEAGAVVDEISIAGFNANGVGGEVGLSDITTELNGPGFSAEAGADWTASLSARLGWLAHPETMLYVIGGYSYADVSIDISGVGISGPSEDFHGFHLGAGMETYLSQNITARVEYRYTQYGGEDFGIGGGLDIEPSSHTGRLGVAYKFGL